MILAALVYLAFGLLLMSYMCPCWHPFELLIGAIIWPISAVIGIIVSLREAKATPMLDNWTVYQMAMVIILAEKAAKQAAAKLAEEAKQKAAPNA